MRKICALAAVSMLAGASAVRGGVMITEWMYNGLGVSQVGEYVEFTNTGPAAVDMSNYSFDDSSRTAGSQALGAFGIIAVGESVIFTDVTAATFRTNWNVPLSIKVIGGNANNLGRADEINLYDGMNPLTAVLVDRLTYDDQLLGGPRTSAVSGKVLPENYGLNVANLALASSVGDGLSYSSSLLEVGSPGMVPEPAGLALASAAGLLLSRRRRAAVK